MTRTNLIGVAMLVVAVAWASIPVPAEMTKVSALAGAWDGWWIEATSFPLEVTINPDGSYISRLGAESGTGTFRMVNGAIITEGHLSGADTPISDRAATVTLIEKNGAAMLAGDGRTSAGPYAFTLARR